jgi:hypothetical protein
MNHVKEEILHHQTAFENGLILGHSNHNASLIALS